MKLYEIEEALIMSVSRITEVENELNTLLTSTDGEITPDAEALVKEQEELQQVLDINCENLESKAVSYAKYIKELTAFADACKVQADEFAKKAKVAENKVDWLKKHLCGALRVLGFDKFNAGLFKLSVRESESVEVAKDVALPEDYITRKVTIAPNKVAIKQALKAGETINGCILVKNHSLTIK